ncbi:hypothetical protein BDBG_06031 [Blastomyces gilchristii SLH14081]|uniref:Uncharacterized protein n=1 Tax=Blastomyces gilchristii (strain SLH14081) TaxID=559298 RepID=A0A179UVE7_BLAGS|nr:uncharacterized protein BDBG_06031 [Blastomyces gilchristii SLH14081]OAT11067.1 hypothetical protein BDBG_06031 [Blastomyces gilchristii SLH14081]
MECDEDEMLARAFQASIQLHEEHQRNVEDAAISELEEEERVLRESEAAAAEAQRTRQGEEELLQLILERSVADADEGRVRRRRMAEDERARLDRLFGSGRSWGMDRESLLSAQEEERIDRVLRDDDPLYAEPEEYERSSVRRESTTDPTSAHPRPRSGAPRRRRPRRLLIGSLRPPAAAIARRNTSPAAQTRSSRSTQASEPAPRYDHCTRYRPPRASADAPSSTSSTSSISRSRSGRTHRRSHRDPLSPIATYSLDEVLVRSRHDSFPTGLTSAAVEELNHAEMQAAINESAGGRCRDEDEEAIRRNRGVPTYTEAVYMKRYGAPRGRRYVFQGPSSVTFEGEGGGKMRWEIVGDMDLGEALRAANRNVL